MYSVAVLAFVSFVLALILTPVCRNLFRHLGVVDHPDGLRKLHTSPVPRVGGVPLMLAYLGAFAVLLVSPLAATRVVETGLPTAWKILPGAALVFAIGLLDDLHGLKPWHKFAGQAVAASVVIWAGVHVTAVGGWVMPLWLSLPITLVWLVGCSNAFNLIDGVDGLAAGAGLFATITILVGALLTKNVTLTLAMVPLAGALLGFLRYNFNPASIFLGDSGSLTIGFLLGCYGVVWSEKAATILGMTAPLMALALPLLDTAVAIARRFIRQQPLTSADAGHIHHRLLALGLTPRKTALVLYAACGIAASLSLLGMLAHDQYKGLVILVFCAAAWIGVQHLGYVEFGVAGQMVMGGAFRRHLSNELAVRAFDEALAASTTAEDRWTVICEACRQFGFTQAELQFNGQRFEETLADTNGDPVWNLDIPLAGSGRLRLTRRFGESHVPTVLAPIAEALHKHLCGNGVPQSNSASHAKATPGTSLHVFSVSSVSAVKYMLVAGARPNFMKIAPIHRAFSSKRDEHSPTNLVLVHTGQHYGRNMSEDLFRDLGIPEPDINLEVGSGSHAEQTARIMREFERACLEHRPDWVIVVGDVNSTLACAITAKKLGIRVAHVEAGLRSRDMSMPEEINRLCTDAISDLLFTTDTLASENLRNEGVEAGKIHFVGNTMIDSLRQEIGRARELPLPDGLVAGHYAVLTLHRPANVDSPDRLALILGAINAIAERIPVIFPVHPRTAPRLKEFGLHPGIRTVEPMSYLPFLSLMASSRMVLTDSGGIQEETTVLGIPCLTMRHNTERPITCQIGTNVLVGTDPQRIVREAESIIDGKIHSSSIPEKWDGLAAERIVEILLNQPVHDAGLVGV